MPTIVRESGFRVRIHGSPREHRPPHVHVVKRGAGEVVLELGSERSDLRVRQVRDMDDRDVLVAFRIVERYHDRLLKAWRAIHE